MAVQEEHAAVLDIVHHVVVRDVRRVVARHEIRLVDEVGGFDGLVPEPQVRNGKTARLFGIVEEIALRVLVGMVADNLDGVFVRADRAVAAQAVELAAHSALGRGVDKLGEIERRVGYVVGNADSEVVFGRFGGEAFVHRVDHGRIEFLRAQAVATAVNLDIGFARLDKRGANIEVQRLAEAARLFGAVENGETLDRFGQRLDEMLDRERTVQTHFEQADFFALLGIVVDGLLDGFAARAHHYDDVLGVLVAVVLEQLVLSARELGNLVHHRLHDFGRGVVVFVCRLAVLEIDIRVLRSALLVRVVGVERAVLELADFLHAPRFFGELANLVVFDTVGFVNLVAGAEAVEEMQERHLRFERGKVRYEREVHRLLDGVGREHGKAGLAARHNVRMVAEYVKRVRCERACADVENGGQKLA